MVGLAGSGQYAVTARPSGPAADALDLDARLAQVWPRFTPPVRDSLQHLLANYRAPVTLDQLSAVAGRTAFQLIRLFRRELGITPHAMLIRIRIQRAKALLARGEPIAGVAADVGFVDQTHFGRHFKRILNETPARFRSAARATAEAGTPSGLGWTA
jgi:transcriptional regulator GlxA family with amidase domain